jgi:hypothetical protein
MLSACPQLAWRTRCESHPCEILVAPIARADPVTLTSPGRLSNPSKRTQGAYMSMTVPCRACEGGWTRRESVPGLDHIFADDAGGIWSDRSGKFRRLAEHPHLLHSYMQVQTPIGGGRSKVRSVHRLIGSAFFGPLPAGLETRHLDGNRHHNCLTNLRYGTKAENEEDRARHGRSLGAGRKLNEQDDRDIQAARDAGVAYRVLMERYGVGMRAICNAAKRAT